jgi:hypothetical protein
MKKCIITLLILVTSIAAAQASTCIKDLNGNGIIDANTEKWNCLATEPPICPQGIMNCTTLAITLSGMINASPTNVKDKIGITSISADSQGTSLIMSGWMCSNIACSSGNIGTIKIQNATVSGSVAADKISRIVGNGSNLEIFGCDGGTACAETMIGKVNINGSLITGSAAADAGIISIAASSSTLSISGMTCSNSGCYQINAGTLAITGLNAVCPAGSQYSCVDVSGVKKCSPLTCNDDTYGGKVSPGQQICVKDFNNDGTIDFSSEMAICRQYNNQYYCPLQTQDCSTMENTAVPTCPSGGTLNPTTKICEASPTTQYSCPSGYTLGAGNICMASPVCTQGTLNNHSFQCVIGTITSCPWGAQYECFPNTEKNNVMQCSNIPCIDGSTQGSNPKTSDNSSYHDDGPKDNTGKCLGTLMIFNGKPLECRPSGVNTNFFNCCDQSAGSFLFVKKMCGEPDTECVAKASTGSCHFIGDYCKQEWPLIGCVQHANVFCCFNSMMARIIQEQGRSQLQSFSGWGSVGAPDCRGFTVEEFSHLDFSRIDLSEYINATKTKMNNKMQIIQNKITQQNESKIKEKIP